MTTAIVSQHLKHRRTKRDAFIARPHRYKVCDQCRSISLVAARHSPVCHAYRWNESAKTGVCIARQVGASAFGKCFS
jgi:hypothetical protein